MEEKIDDVKQEVKNTVDLLEKDFHKVRKNPSLLGSVLRELWLTFRKPLLAFIAGFVLLFILVPPLTYLYFIRDLSSKENIINHKNAGVILVDRKDRPFFTLYEGRTKNTASISSIPISVQEGVISVEDKRFYSEPGFSIQGIGRALISDVKDNQLAQGGSTITQQLVKNTLLTQEKSFLRKYQEIFLALEVERRFSKKDILEMYLNTVYFGEGAYGIQDAAKTYFGKDVEDLTLAESALLSAILPAPSAYSPLTGDKAKAFSRQKIVLQQMLSQGYITQAQESAAEDEKIIFNPTSTDINVTAPHFALMVKQELINKYGEQKVANSGFIVKTTIDLDNQLYAEKTVKNQVANLKYNKVTNGAAVAIDPKTGEILSLVGSHDWFNEDNGKINMALTPRQPGSSFKPIVYTLALDKRLITPATALDDKPIKYPDGYEPFDYDRKFRGTVLVRRALANSLNIPALHVIEKVGIPDTLDFAKQLGITTLKNPSDYGISLVLGAGEVPLLQMTEAYGTFANNGTRVTPTTILEIKDKQGDVVYKHKPDPVEILPPDVTFLISSILSDNVTRAEEFGNALTISRPAAVKTGTTNDYKDALTIGYTPSLVVGVWVGNNDNTSMDTIAGSLGAAPIWRQMMEHMLAGTPIEKFTPSSGIIKVSVCKEKGYKIRNATSSAITEFFLPGTSPTRYCDESLIPTPSLFESPTPTTQPEHHDDPTATPTPVATNTPVPQDTPTPTPLTVPLTITP
ncbi:PBP1A family penicillin-binding protein [soil metagenome]